MNVVAIRASVDEKVRWDEAAKRDGLTFSAWARRSLNDAAALEDVLAREGEQNVIPDFKEGQ